MSMGRSNSSFMMRTSTSPSMWPDLSEGPPMAVQASRVASSFQPLTSASRFRRQMSSSCSKQMRPLFLWSSSEMSLHSQNSSRWRSRRWRAVSRSYMLMQPLFSSSRSSTASRQLQMSSSLRTYSILLFIYIGHRQQRHCPWSSYLLLFSPTGRSPALVPGLPGLWSLGGRYKNQRQIDRRMFSQFCRSVACLKEAEKSHEVEVSAFFPVQQQINQLPSFEHIYHHEDQHLALLSPRNQASASQQQRAPSLKRVRSEPQALAFTPAGNDKENARGSQSTEYDLLPSTAQQRSAPRPPVNIQYCQSEKRSFRVEGGRSRVPISSFEGQFPPGSNASSVSHKPSSLLGYSGDSGSMVSAEEFNRVVNINKSLIMLLQADLRIPSAVAGEVRQAQSERGRLIDQLEERVHRLKRRMGAGRREPPLRTFC